VRCALRLTGADGGDELATELAEAVDLVGSVAGKAPTRVFAQARREVGRYVLAHLVLEDNVVGTAEVHVAPADERAFPLWEQLVVVGTKGTLRAGTGFEGKLIHGGTEPLAGCVEALRRMAAHVRGGPPPMPPAEARQAVRVCLAAELSAESGKPVGVGKGRGR
jgi:predicted dehydrogenase